MFLPCLACSIQSRLIPQKQRSSVHAATNTQFKTPNVQCETSENLPNCPPLPTTHRSQTSQHPLGIKHHTAMPTFSNPIWMKATIRYFVPYMHWKKSFTTRSSALFTSQVWSHGESVGGHCWEVSDQREGWGLDVEGFGLFCSVQKFFSMYVSMFIKPPCSWVQAKASAIFFSSVFKLAHIWGNIRSWLGGSIVWSQCRTCQRMLKFFGRGLRMWLFPLLHVFEKLGELQIEEL